jgi:hypothetical protein
MDRTSSGSITIGVALFILTACDDQRPMPARHELPPRPVASIQEIMQSEIDPAADALWDSVATESSDRGVTEHRPRTDDEWLVVRRHAITLVEAANLLVMPGRRVARRGKTLEDSHVPGILDAAHIQQAIERDPASFLTHARALQDAGLQALKAIDAHDARGLLDAGSQIDSACERCHLKYWYPEDQQPKGVGAAAPASDSDSG